MKQNTLWVDKEPTLSYKMGQQKTAVAVVLSAVLTAYILSICVALFWSSAAFTIAQPLLFLAVGLLHVYRLKNDFRLLTATQKWIYTLAVAATIFLLFAIAPVWGLRFSFLTMVAGAVAFLLPAVLAELLQTYVQFAFGNATTWQATNEGSLTYPDVYMAGMPVRFKIMLEENEKPSFQTKFRTLAEMNLGEVFYDMAQKQNKKGIDTIDLFDDQKHPYRWLFFTYNFLGLIRPLDSKRSLHSNHLRKNSTIYAQRLLANDVIVSKGQKELNAMI